jgi:hypothetical protein
MSDAPQHHRIRGGKKEVPVRSVRVDNELWEKARRRATYEGVTMSQVLYEFTKGYADGMLDRPQRQMVFTPARAPESTDGLA